MVIGHCLYLLVISSEFLGYFTKMFFWLLITLQLICLLTGFFTICRLFYIFWTFNRGGVPYVPTPRGIIKKMVLLGQSHAEKPMQKIADIGSGSGKMLFHLARRMPPPIVCFGIERSWMLYSIARLRRFFSAQKKRIVLIHNSWNNQSLKRYDAVFLFLTTQGMTELLPKFSQELEPGAIIASYMFPLPPNDAFYEHRYNYAKALGRIFVYVKK